MNITIHKGGADGMIKMADKILEKHGWSTELGLIPLEVKGQATISALAKIKRCESFSPYDVEKLAKMNNITLPREIEKFIYGIGYVKWTEMTTDTRDYLMAMLIKLFEQPILQSQL